MELLTALAQTLRNLNISSEKDLMLVGFSGGADSTALLLALHTLGYTCHAVHVNFHLREAESERDENFCKTFCANRAIGLSVHHCDAQAQAKAQGVSVEMAARDIRYAYFEKLRTAMGYTYTAVAHHLEDNAETLLLNMVRGTGIRGLCGMQVRSGHLLRPLLAITKADLLAYLTATGTHYVTDSSNASLIYKRNMIRHVALPALQQLNPALYHTMGQNALRMSEAFTLYEVGLESILAQVFITRSEHAATLSIAQLVGSPAVGTVLYEALRPYGFTQHQSNHILQAITGQSGAQYSSETHILVRDRETLRILPHSSLTAGTPPSIPLFLETITTLWDEWGELSVGALQTYAPGTAPILRSPHTVAIDASQVHVKKLLCRPPLTGDRLRPLGMQGSKLVSDILTEGKIPRPLKATYPIVCNGHEIIWLPGLRLAAAYQVTQHTTQVLTLSWQHP